MSISVKSLSFSTVSQFVNCSQRVFYEKIEHLPKKQGMTSKQLYGISIHSCIAAFFRGLLNHVTLDLEQLVRVFRVRYSAWPANDIVENEQSIDIDTMCGEAHTMLEMFLAAKPPQNIISIEKPVKFAMTSTLDCVGQVDLVVRDAEGVLNVIDIKTTSKSPAEDQIQKYAEQCLVYALGFQEPVKAKAWLFLRRKKNPEFQTLDLDINGIEYSEIVEKFTGVARAISAGIFLGRNRSWQCSSCPYSYMCSREPVQVDEELKEAA